MPEGETIEGDSIQGKIRGLIDVNTIDVNNGRQGVSLVGRLTVDGEKDAKIVPYIDFIADYFAQYLTGQIMLKKGKVVTSGSDGRHSVTLIYNTSQEVQERLEFTVSKSIADPPNVSVIISADYGVEARALTDRPEPDDTPHFSKMMQKRITTYQGIVSGFSNLLAVSAPDTTPRGA